MENLIFQSDYTSQNIGSWMSGFGIFILVLVVWSFLWKGWALWVAARQSQKGWFVALLILNTLGILEILYIFVFSKKARQVNGVPPTPGPTLK